MTTKEYVIKSTKAQGVPVKVQSKATLLDVANLLVK